MTARTLRTTPAKPCCDACVIDALTRASVDYTEPFVIYSNLQALTPRRRRELVDALIATAEGEIFVLVSSPVPAELRNQQAEETDGTAPSADDLEAMFSAVDH